MFKFHSINITIIIILKLLFRWATNVKKQIRFFFCFFMKKHFFLNSVYTPQENELLRIVFILFLWKWSNKNNKISCFHFAMKINKFTLGYWSSLLNLKLFLLERKLRKLSKFRAQCFLIMFGKLLKITEKNPAYEISDNLMF